MKRKGGFYNALCNIDNIELADKNARKGKKSSKDFILKHDLNHDAENQELLNQFLTGTFRTSNYSIYELFERNKLRTIYRLPYYPDRIAQHAIMNVTKEYWTNLFIRETYSCIEGRGIHKCLKDLNNALRRFPNQTTYCLKIDIKKFYPSITHPSLKRILSSKIKDKRFRAILYEVIDSVNSCSDVKGIGVPIGNYLSQYFANLALCPFDHYCKEVLHCKFYFRYADDIVFLSDSKEFLHEVFHKIKEYLETKLSLQIKPNYQIFPVEARGIDFVGYVSYHKKILLRKSLKLSIMKVLHKYQNKEITLEELTCTMSSYFGWMKYANTKNLLKKIYRITGLNFSNFNGTKDIISNYKDKLVFVVQVETHNKYFNIHFIYNNKPYTVRSTNKKLYNRLHPMQHSYILTSQN